MHSKIDPTIWHDCYNKGLKGFITEDSFAHPAKMSFALCERIIDYCLERGWLKKGDVVGDPFNGVCTVGLVSAYRGLRYIGVELEPKFVKLSQDNIALHRSRLELMGLPVPEVIQGDSRKFHELVEAAGIVSSPPFTQGYQSGGGINKKGYGPNGEDKVGERTYQALGGDRVDGNIETLKEGSVEAVVSSPPYADGLGHGGGRDLHQPGYPGTVTLAGQKEGYGSVEGQIDNLSTGNVEAVVSSPPWENNSEGSTRKSKFNYVLTNDKGHGSSQEAKARAMERDEQKVYGDSPGQIGKLKGGTVDGIATSPPYGEQCTNGARENRAANLEKAGIDSKAWLGERRCTIGRSEGYGKSEGQIGGEQPETYWQAVAQVYASCFQAIKPGGVICLVVKDYVKAGNRVPLCDDTARLLQHTGFTVIERIHAMLVKETRHDDFFQGETVQTTSRKSFFRRLAESKGSPKIDFEEVIIALRP